MTAPIRNRDLSHRVAVQLQDLLEELNAAEHDASRMVEQSGGLPGWSRRTLFYALGYIAKADGRVTGLDIRYAEGLMKALDLSPRQRKKAIDQFHRGKATETLFPLRGLRLRMAATLSPGAALTVACCLVHAAQLHGRPSRARRYRCEHACDLMGLSPAVMNSILESYAASLWGGKVEQLEEPGTLADACRILGVTQRDTLVTIKRAYRRKVATCHPDKLPPDLPPREREEARDRLLRYQQAWELVQRRHKAFP